jgi:hypothetical protein
MPNTVNFLLGAALAFLIVRLGMIWTKIPVKHSRWKGRIAFAAVACALIGFLVWGWTFYQEHIDTEIGSPAINIEDLKVLPRDPKTDIPFLVDVYFKSDTELIETTSSGFLLDPTVEIPPDALDENFRGMHAFLMSFSPARLSPLPANEHHFISVLGEHSVIIRDRDVEEIASGSRALYVLVSWRYRLPHSSTIFLRDFCAYFEGTFANWKACAGKHNTTFVAR